MARKKNRSKIAEVRFTGEEPEFEGELSKAELLLAYNWYNYFYTIKDTRKWITEWMAANGYDDKAVRIIAKTSNTTLTQTCASQARMMTRGASNTDVGCYLLDRLDAIIAGEPTNKKEAKAEPLNDVPNMLIADLDDALDVYFRTGKMQNVKKIVLNRKPREMSEALDYFDGLLDFACGEKPLPKSIEQLIHIVDAVGTEKINRTRRKPRKPRAKKVLSAERIVSKVKYLAESEEYSVVSINPTQILRATTLLTFNVKYRILTRYMSADGKPFGMKGTTIQNIDQTKTFAMRIRKPSQVLPCIVSDGKRKIDTMLKNLTTKQIEAGDRINKNTLILRSF